MFFRWSLSPIAPAQSAGCLWPCSLFETHRSRVRARPSLQFRMCAKRTPYFSSWQKWVSALALRSVAVAAPPRLRGQGRGGGDGTEGVTRSFVRILLRKCGPFC